MKNIIRTLLVVLAAFAVLMPTVGAQTYLTTTTLSAAITTPTPTVPAASTIALTSTAGITAAYCGGAVSNCGLYVDREFMAVVSVPASGSVQVQRGANSTVPSLHRSLRTVIIAPKTVFTTSDYDQSTGRGPGAACTATSFTYLPIVNISNGNVWLCRPGVVTINSSTAQAAWVATNTGVITYNSLLVNLQ